MIYNNDGLIIPDNIFVQKLQARYTLDNLYRKKLIARGDRFRHKTMPEKFQIYKKVEGGYLIPPGLLGTTWCPYIKKETVHDIVTQPLFQATLREEQQKVIQYITQKPVGLVVASTGSGKSYMILSLTSQLNRNTLIVVSSTPTLTEMVEKCQSLLGVTPRVIGGKKKYKQTCDTITLCMLQSIDSGKINPKEFGAIIVDECDVAISTTERQKFWYTVAPEFMYGFTATTKINHQEDHLINLFFWEANETLKVNNFVPRIYQVWSNYAYSGTLDSDAEFSRMMSEIADDRRRNKLIVDTIESTIKKTETKKGLVLVKIVAQAYLLAEALKERGIKSEVIVGETKEEERKEIRDRVAKTLEPIVLIGSAQILWRGFDFPPLQACYITYPNKFQAALVQAAGRVTRKFPWKTFAAIYDFVDPMEEWLLRQSQTRARTYKKEYGSIVQRLIVENW